MKKLSLSLAALSLTSVGLLTPNYAHNHNTTVNQDSSLQQRKANMQKRRTARMEKSFAQVGVTDAQRAEIQSIRESYRPQMQALRAEGKQLRQDKQALDPSSSDFVRQTQVVFDQRTAHKRQVVTMRAQMRQEVARVLTSEQRTELKEIRKTQKKRMKKRRKNNR